MGADFAREEIDRHLEGHRAYRDSLHEHPSKHLRIKQPVINTDQDQIEVEVQLCDAERLPDGTRRGRYLLSDRNTGELPPTPHWLSPFMSPDGQVQIDFDADKEGVLLRHPRRKRR